MQVRIYEHCDAHSTKNRCKLNQKLIALCGAEDSQKTDTMTARGHPPRQSVSEAGVRVQESVESYKPILWDQILSARYNKALGIIVVRSPLLNGRHFISRWEQRVREPGAYYSPSKTTAVLRADFLLIGRIC